MTGPEHYRLAEQYADEARQRLDQNDLAAGAAWAALAQVHAQLASTPSSVQVDSQFIQGPPPSLTGEPREPVRRPRGRAVANRRAPWSPSRHPPHPAVATTRPPRLTTQASTALSKLRQPGLSQRLAGADVYWTTQRGLVGES